MRLRRPALPIALAALGLGLLGASPAAATPILKLGIHHNPTNFAPGAPAIKSVTTLTEGAPPATDEVQRLTIRATSGQFRLRFGAETTTDLSHEAGAEKVEAALRALPSIGSPNVTVETARRNTPFTVTFGGALAGADVPQIAILDGSSPLRRHPELWFDIWNVGDSPTSGSITLTVKLPAGLSRQAVIHNLGGFENEGCPGSPGDTTIVCTLSGLLAGSIPPGVRFTATRIAVYVPAGSGDRLVSATASGGGAPQAPPGEGCPQGAGACASEVVHIASEEAGFGILAQSFTPDFLAADRIGPVRQSGAHPDFFSVPFDFHTIFGSQGTPEEMTTPGNVRDLQLNLPPGFLGNPTAVGECTQAAFTNGECPPSSTVGRLQLRANDNLISIRGVTFANGFGGALAYNLSHPRGVITDIGFAILGNPVHIRASLDPADAYAVKITVPDINETLQVYDQQFDTWGVPGDPSHDFERCKGGDAECPAGIPAKPFLTVPFECGVEHQIRLHHYDSWQNTGVFGPDLTYTMPGKFTGCERPRFEPDVEIVPTGHQANFPTGLDVHIKIAQNENPDALATPPVQRFTVTLPPGMSFSPSFADGLKSCSLDQIGLETNDPVECPDASRIGEVTLHTPLLPRSAEGSMYLAAQGDNPFGSLFALYLVLHDTEERGTLIKIPGRIDVDPVTGQITTVFEDTPQFPFDDLVLKFRSGPRAPLINPPFCGAHTIGVEVASYAQPDNPVDASNTYEVSEGPNGTPCPPDSAHRPFAPRFAGGTLNPVAGSYSTFLFRLSRGDDEQELSQVNTFLPPGLVAKIAGIPFCSDQALASISTELGTGAVEQATPACPPASQIGTLSVGLGAGPGPNYFPGKVYLAGPYKGAPLSLAIVAPGLAGPFDLGNVVVRVALRVDSDTSRVTAVSDPFPTILHGVILRDRDVRLRLDRPETTLNPTNCEPTSLDAQITGVGGDLLSTTDDSLFNASDYFQVGDCGRLGFKPQLAFKLKGGTHRGDHPAFSSRLVARPGDANIGRAIVALPRSEFLENAHIRTVCTRVQFAAEQCPQASVYGYAKAVTPLLDNPVEGPVILRSSDHPLPDLVAVLRGQISANLIGRIDSVNGGIRTSFDSVPDVPVREFTLSMQGGKKGLFVNSRNLCLAPARADVRFTAQNGKRLHLRPLMQNGCKKTGRKGKRKRHHRRG